MMEDEMDYNISLNSEAGKAIDNENISRSSIDKESNNGGLINLKQGQQITGTVITVDEQVTIDFNGQRISTSKEVLKNAVPGDVRTFEVVKASSTEIELRLIEETGYRQQKTIKAVMLQEMDWETVLSQKNYNSKRMEKEQLSSEIKSKLQNISAKLTAEDYYTLEKEGFPVDRLSINGLYEAVGRVKEEASFKKDTEATTKKAVTANQTTEEISDRLKAEDLPATSQNISNIKTALQLSETVSKLDNKAMRYLIAGEMQPTIENLYKAYFSGSTASRGMRQELSKEAWSELEAQVKEVIVDAGYEVNEDNLADARWLIENNLPLTEKNFTYKKELESLKQKADKDYVLDRIIEGLKNGTAPGKAILIETSEVSFQKIKSDINAISEEAVTYAVYTDSKLTIKKLTEIQKNIDSRKIQLDSVIAQKQRILNEQRQQMEISRDQMPRNQVQQERRQQAEIPNDQIQKKQDQEEGRPQAELPRDQIERDPVLAERRSSGAAVREPAQEVPRQNKTEQEQRDFVQEERRPQAELPRDQIERDPVLAERRSSGVAVRESVQTEPRQHKPISRELSQVESDLTTDTEAGKNSNSSSEEHSAGQDNSSTKYKDYPYEVIKAQRQLEEIRLKMTLEATKTMEKNGISIKTRELEKVVEELRKIEDSYYNKLLKEAEAPATEEALRTLRDTTNSLAQLRTIPCYVLGRTLARQSTQTIPSLLSEGYRLQAELERAGAAYETLMTVPNAEYGDSIRKAFANMDSLLSELNIESTAVNQRAVRILSYNQMELTPENIDRVKAYDNEVTTLINNLHPAVTVRMIKEGINPLNMPIGQLNDEIDRMKKEQGITSEEKFSTYLHKLEKNNAISPEERKAYIGIYRLLYNVEKSDGAVLGSVIRTDREVTLSNLLSAVQTRSKGKLEAVIDDEFGTLSELSTTKETISEQLRAFTRSNARNQRQSQIQKGEGEIAEQSRYMNRILQQITEEISPERLNQVQQGADQVNTTHSQSAVWESVKDIPLEKLLQQLQSTEEAQNTARELYTQRVEQLRQLSQSSEQSIRFLNDYQITSTPQNIIMANHLLSNGESPIVRLLKRQNENKMENSKNGLKELENLSDKLIDKSSINDVYEALEASAKDVLEKACMQETINSAKLTELKNVSRQLTFLRTLASKEYYQIPIETPRGITNINLTILRGTGNAGSVSVAVRSEQLGNIKAEFSFKDQTMKGFISGEGRPQIERLQANTVEIEKAAKESNITLQQLDFAFSRRDSDGYSYKAPDIGETAPSTGSDTERKLYRIAKAFVQLVRRAENSEEMLQKEVS
jgi:hypothetical protein